MKRRTFVTGIGAAALAAAPLRPRAAAAQATRGGVLVPQTRAGHGRIAFDFPGLAIGTADYAEGPTGCTVFVFPGRGLAAMDVRGGAAGTIGDYTACDAICLAGGSALGLEAATGVAAELFAQRGRLGTALPLVMGAVIYDFGNRNNAAYPDKACGRAALRAAVPGAFSLGRCGAGSHATVGKAWSPKYKGEFAGQGGAVTAIGPTRIGVFTVVNALGAIVDRTGKVVRGNRGGRRPPRLDRRRHRSEGGRRRPAAGQHDPDGRRDQPALRSRRPAADRPPGPRRHGARDPAVSRPCRRDVLYTVSTMQVDNPPISDFTVAAVAGELAWDAVLNCFEPD